MSRFDTARRGISLVLAVFCLLVVPELASAKFQSQATATQSVGTAMLAAPTRVDGNYRCQQGLLFVYPDTIHITTDTVTHLNPSSLSYTYSYDLVRAGSVVDTATTTSPTTDTSLSGEKTRDLSSTTWTLRVRVGYRNWQSAPYERPITCPVYGSPLSPL